MLATYLVLCLLDLIPGDHPSWRRAKELAASLAE